MAVKLKNRIDEETGRFLCSNPKCGTEVGIGIIIKGYVYCTKCGEKIQGKRDENGLLLKNSEKVLLQPEVEKAGNQLVPGRAKTPPVKREPLLQPSSVVEVGQGVVTGLPSGNKIPDMIMMLTFKGLSSREIANSFKKDGIPISHMTVSRMQNKLRQGILL